MKIKVLRMTLKNFNDLVDSLGTQVRYFDVPSTETGIKFRGCYTNKDCKEIAVSWPIDRPAFAQQEYSDKYECGFPVDEFEITETMN